MYRAATTGILILHLVGCAASKYHNIPETEGFYFSPWDNIIITYQHYNDFRTIELTCMGQLTVIRDTASNFARAVMINSDSLISCNIFYETFWKDPCIPNNVASIELGISATEVISWKKKSCVFRFDNMSEAQPYLRRFLLLINQYLSPSDKIF